ncbi:8745_t:CDS:2 [Ambispora leptoticha]|uniref:8745_t:CDS:1 n=1 Tax=Ambispora leptoticha TaxID=144679 RepID=A0A9N9HMJ6_9GLOM|nr:8745_t:CDS:2 [Ambispora leptoticha]
MSEEDMRKREVINEKRSSTYDSPFSKKTTSSSRLATYIIERQIGKFICSFEIHFAELPLIIIGTIILGYLVNPTSRNPFSKFLFVAYPIGSHHDHTKLTKISYGKGLWDLCLISFWVVVFTFTREAIMQYVLKPLGTWAEIKKSKLTRFMEQGYVVIYYSISSAVGVYMMRQSPYWYFETKYFWIDYPHFHLSALEKYYYLIQSGFWLQQVVILILNLEKPRKDFLELVAHHVITCVLIGGSYLFNFTRIGNAVFITMDFSDIWLAVAKCLKYLQFPTLITDSMFVLFMITWAYTRHYLYGFITYSTVFEACLPDINPCIWDPLNGYWLHKWTRFIIALGLMALQILMIYWFVLILRIAWRVLNGKNAEDTRSDTEDDEITPSNPTNTKKSD